MTYEKIVEKVKKALAKVDASAVKGHLAVQVDVYGEGEGAFYIEVKDGKVDVQPYEYFDHDLRIRCTGEEIIAIAEGKKKILDEVAAENIEALRNVSRLGDFDLVFVGRSVKNKAAKKTKVSVPATGKTAKTVKKETPAKPVKESKIKAPAMVSETAKKKIPAKAAKPAKAKAAKTTDKKTK
ncbi:MAG: hypothetical protein IK014_02150 [Lachnospiraceae bacterium]|nr:hypothetical protein [Lachnospiraceae bacterium]